MKWKLDERKEINETKILQIRKLMKWPIDEK